MSLLYGNPTAIRVGLTGEIFGHHARVVGRSVLKTDDGYRWDEYHLAFDDGTATTLVYESGLWKQFDLIDTEKPITAEAAAECAVGDQLTLGGHVTKITYVGKSSVRYIEGTAPEGYRVGSRADYFNAESLGHLYVVSWTGSEVEYYEGEKLPRGTVERAFGVRGPSLLARATAGGSGGMDSWFDSDHRLAALVLGLLVFFGYLVFREATPQVLTAAPPAPIAAPAAHFQLKTPGRLDGHDFLIVGHRVSEIAEMAGQLRRHEYYLVDELGESALLIQGLVRSAPQWYLLRPVAGPPAFPPEMAGGLKSGGRFRLGDERAVVRTLFLGRAVSWDGDVAPEDRGGGVYYGFTAQTSGGWALVRWDESTVTFAAGRMFSRADIEHAFGPGVLY